MEANGCQDKSKTKLVEELCEFKENLVKNLIEDAKSAKMVADAVQQGKCRMAIDQGELFKFSRMGYNQYQNFKVDLTAKLVRQSESFKSEVGKLQDEGKKELDANFKKVLDGLKELSAKTKSIYSIVCRVESEKADNCNSKQLTILNKTQSIGDITCSDKVLSLSNTEDESTTSSEEGTAAPLSEDDGSTNGKEEKYFDTLFKKISERSRCLNDVVNATKDKSVRIASTNASINFEVLRAAGGEFNKGVGELDSKVKECVGTFESEVKESCESLAKAEADHSGAIFEERILANKEKALENLKPKVVIPGVKCEWELE